MSLFPAVKNVRELKRGVQADVVIGESRSDGVVSIQVITQDPDVLKAMEAVKFHLEAVAGRMIKAAQDDQERRGEEALGR